MSPASLLTSTDSTSHVHLIVGSNPLALARCSKSLEVGAIPKLVAPAIAELHYALQRKIDNGDVEWLKKSFDEDDALRLGREAINHVVDAVFVTLEAGDVRTDVKMGAHISQFCKRHRIPVNVSDAAHLSTFSILSTHTDGPLQIGITTNGKGCKLATRIRRELASSLPANLGAACIRLGTIRRRIQEEDHLAHLAAEGGLTDDESSDQIASFNKLVSEVDFDAAKNRRIRWLSQICEYWPLSRLASITDEDVENMLKSYSAKPSTPSQGLNGKTQKGKVILAGSGPGHPDLLTRATHKAILAADLVLADKLVPSGVLDLIPRRTPVHIARKFPGNAEQAQQELLEMGLAGVKAGQMVLRLKQGDPYLYGRGGEEVDFFRSEGFGDVVTVLPGITSALSGPLFAGIPVTQRAVSDQVLICTGTGRRGKPTVPPEFVETRTVVFLMALHRLRGLVADLTRWDSEDAMVENTDGSIDQRRRLWPKTTPCAVSERASCSDQRIIRTTLECVVSAVEEQGSRPPGLLVVGAACQVLHSIDPNKQWVVEDGFPGILDFEESNLLDTIVDQTQSSPVVEGSSPV